MNRTHQRRLSRLKASKVKHRLRTRLEVYRQQRLFLERQEAPAPKREIWPYLSPPPLLPLPPEPWTPDLQPLKPNPFWTSGAYRP